MSNLIGDDVATGESRSSLEAVLEPPNARSTR